MCQILGELAIIRTSSVSPRMRNESDAVGDEEEKRIDEWRIYEKKIESYQKELGNTQAKLTITRMETMETRLNCDLFLNDIQEQIQRMEIIHHQFNRLDQEEKKEGVSSDYPENIFLELYEMIEKMPRYNSKDKERLQNEVQKIQNIYEEKQLRNLETISTLQLQIEHLSQRKSSQFDDNRVERISREKDLLGIEVQKLEKELLETKIKCEQLKIEMNTAKISHEQLKNELNETRQELVRRSANSDFVEKELSLVRDELASTKRKLDVVPQSHFLSSQSKDNSDLNLKSRRNLSVSVGQDEQKPIRCSIHQASSLSDLEFSYQTLRSDYLQCQLDLSAREKTISTLTDQLKAKESELLTVQEDYSTLFSSLRNQVANQDEVSQKTFMRDLGGIIEEKLNESKGSKGSKGVTADVIPAPLDLFQLTDEYCHVLNNYQMEIQSLKLELFDKDQVIERLTAEIAEKNQESQFQIHAAMDGLRRQMEGFKTEFLQKQAHPCSPSEIQDYDVESLSKVRPSLYFLFSLHFTSLHFTHSRSLSVPRWNWLNSTMSSVSLMEVIVSYTNR
jgi:hypothetical protein